MGDSGLNLLDLQAGNKTSAHGAAAVQSVAAL
jgi:hypothetical protein